MNRILILLTVFLLFLSACSGDSVDPVTPPDFSHSPAENPKSTTHLWGFYGFHFDGETRSIKAVCDRTAMFTTNVTVFLNGTPPGIKFDINEVITGLDYTDIDIDIILTHPFPGLDQYNGYDVRGIFMTNGSGNLDYNEDLSYPVQDVDQLMLANPDPAGDGNGAPDGYTRWFNYAEFSGDGMPMFSYTPGDFASPDFDGTATLNPYRYFADGLGADEDLFDFLVDTDNNGVFSAGATNRRNYYLRFPDSTEVYYGYAVIASWDGDDNHPANTPESVSVKVTDSSMLYYVDDTVKGGNLILDLDVFGWETATCGPVDYDVVIESTVLSSTHAFDGASVGLPGGDNISTYHIDIPADAVTGTEGNEYWIIVEAEGYDYTNDFGSPNLADTDTLAAFFRFDLEVDNSFTPPLEGGVITFGGSGGEYPQDLVVDSEGGIISCGYFMGQTNLDPDGNDPHDQVGGGNMWINKVNSDGSFAWGYTWPSLTGIHSYSWSVAVDSEDNVYMGATYCGTLDFDPDEIGEDFHTASSGGNNLDSCLMKFSSSGDYQWGLDWGGSNRMMVYDIVVFNDQYIYLTGYFFSSCDIDPTDGVDTRFASGSGNGTNSYISKIDIDGTTYLWGHDWGTGGTAYAYDLAVDGGGNAVVVGTCEYTLDLDPTDGVQNYVSHSPGTPYLGDSFVERFHSDGTWDWAFGYGDIYWDLINNVYADSNGNFYILTSFSSPSIDADPDPAEEYIITKLGDTGDYYMYDGFLAKFDSTGNFLWADEFATPEHDGIWGIKLDESENLIVAGHTRGTIDLDPGSGVDNYTSSGENDIYVVKLNSNGEWIWGSGFGGPSWDTPSEVDIGTDGLIYIQGQFRETVDFDPGPGVMEASSNGANDVFINMILPDTGEY